MSGADHDPSGSHSVSGEVGVVVASQERVGVVFIVVSCGILQSHLYAKVTLATSSSQRFPYVFPSIPQTGLNSFVHHSTCISS